MTTKEQERKALEQIRKIVAALGENSYLGSAFDGAFQLAENNIEDDAAYTTSYYIEQTHISELNLRHEKNKWDEQRESLERHLNDARAVIGKQQDAIREKEASTKTLADRNINLASVIDDMKKDVDKRDTEIVNLKAKLYDLMTAVA